MHHHTTPRDPFDRGGSGIGHQNSAVQRPSAPASASDGHGIPLHLGRIAGAAAALALACLAWAPPARADRRIFGYTYPYMTLPEGGFEIEHYLDAYVERLDDPATVDDPTTPEVENVEDDFEIAWRHQIEFEYGITDRWDFGLYNVFRQDYFGPFKYSGLKLRSRYRFAEQGDLFVDPAVYLEIGWFGDELALEQKIILAPMIGDLEIALNLTFEEEFGFAGEETEFEFVFNPTLAVGYHVAEWFAFGVEYYGKLVVEEGEVEYFANYLGPTISFAGRHFWITLAFQPELNDSDGPAQFQARSIFAVVL